MNILQSLVVKQHFEVFTKTCTYNADHLQISSSNEENHAADLHTTHSHVCIHTVCMIAKSFMYHGYWRGGP